MPTWLSHKCTYVSSLMNPLPPPTCPTPLSCHSTRFELPASLSKFPLAISSTYGDVCFNIALIKASFRVSWTERCGQGWTRLSGAWVGRGLARGCGQSPLPSPGGVGRADPATQSSLPGRGLLGVISGCAKPQSRLGQRLAALLRSWSALPLGHTQGSHVQADHREGRRSGAGDGAGLPDSSRRVLTSGKRAAVGEQTPSVRTVLGSAGWAGRTHWARHMGL